MTNEEWVDGFKIVLFILFVIGVLILYAHDIKVEHTDCISHGGQWVHGLNLMARFNTIASNRLVCEANSIPADSGRKNDPIYLTARITGFSGFRPSGGNESHPVRFKTVQNRIGSHKTGSERAN